VKTKYQTISRFCALTIFKWSTTNSQKPTEFQQTPTLHPKTSILPVIEIQKQRHSSSQVRSSFLPTMIKQNPRAIR